MILADILCTIKDSMLDTGYFTTFYEFAEMTKTKTEQGTKSYPRYYIGSGAYKDLYDFDVNGTGYIRKTGTVNITNPNMTDTTSCGTDWLQLNYPLRLVAAVPKVHLSDDAFSDEKLVYEVIQALNGDVTGISNVNSVEAVVRNYQTDRNAVWSAEVSGLEEIINPKLTYLYIDFTLQIIVKTDCLISECYG